eukprot:Selendium_serpulae@DN4688_c0_g1_i6.p1
MSDKKLSDDLYNRKTSKSTGKLRFKNATGRPESTKKRKEKKNDPEEGTNPQDVDSNALPEQEPVEQVQGSGRIVSSGPTINGFESNFKEEIQPGDTILVHHPVSLKVEQRVVEAVLSQRCLTIGQPFTRDLVSTTEFFVRKDSITLKKLAEKEAKLQKESAKRKRSSTDSPEPEGEEADDSQLVQDIISEKLQNRIEKARKKTITYRVKTGMWSYKTVTQEVGVGGTEGEFGADAALDARAKKNRDKHCW